MRRERKKSPMNIRLGKDGKVLRFSTAASAPFAGYEEVNVFEKDNVIAVQGVIRGQYHISGEVGRPRKVLSNAQLISYLCEKFGCELGTTLTAWIGEQDNVLFLGGLQPQRGRYYLDESYTPIEVEYNRRAGDWAYVHDNWIEFTQEVRESMPRRLRAYRCGNAVALVSDPRGALVLTPRRQSGKLTLVSYALANYLRERYHGVEKGMRLRASVLPNGVLLADDLETLVAADITKLDWLSLNENEKCFIKVNANKSGVYMSAQAAKLLREAEHLSLYQGGPCLALKAERNGKLKVIKNKHTHAIYSRDFAQLLESRWHSGERIYLLKHGNLCLLWPEEMKPFELPRPEAFTKIDLMIEQPELRQEKRRQPVVAEARISHG